ncbi:MAG: flagellar motor switch protein FliM [Planctomycetota bacterium]|nr:flagellar motor switch protein FliM [Planctomycetota bacterium]
MAEILDQSDIDSLLSAIDSGEIEAEETDRQIFSRSRRDFDAVEVRDYDFKRPERVSKDQMRALQTLHEGFARNFGAALSGFLRMIAEVHLSTCEQMTYAEFVAALPTPTSFSLIKPAPLEGRVCLEISPLIIYPIIDRLLGGTNQELFIPQRPVTTIEGRLVSQITDRAMAALREAWAGVADIDFSVGEVESNPQIVQIVPPNEVVVVVGFEINLANRAGTMSLCIPYNVIEPLMDSLSAQNWFNSGRLRGSSEYAGRITSRLSRAGIEITGLLGETTITIADLLQMQVGDLVLTEKPASDPVVLCVEGRKKFVAHVGQFKGARALRVIRPVEPTDRL